MIIKKVAFGNNIEAYIENRLENRVNIIFSDDNNKGKTLVMQGLMYSLGYESIFPSTFFYKEYYFYSKIEIDNKIFEFVRKKNLFVIKENGDVRIFDSVAEYKVYFSKHIFPLPRIIKDNQRRMVDLTLFYEIFFLGQDNRNPSNLISKAQFNKVDFENMIYAYMGLDTLDIDEKNIDELKDKIKELKVDKKTLQKKLLLKKENKNIAEIVSKSFDNEEFKRKTDNLSKLNKKISELRRSRTREINRKIKLENLLSELNSLNSELKEGIVKCSECGSDKIIYSNKDLNFDISNVEVRKSIISSIEYNIEEKQELILDFTDNINRNQNFLTNELTAIPSNFKNIIIYQDEILSNVDIDNELFELIRNIEFKELQLKQLNSVESTKKEDKKLLLNDILEKMTSNYYMINPNGNLVFSSLFSKKDATFSGSEGQEYYFSKLLALNNVLKHKFPLIVDSFRDGELSTGKENKMLMYYKSLGKQVILTATLKKEEYDSEKYTSDSELNVLDYSVNEDSKILQEEYAVEFKMILTSLGLSI